MALACSARPSRRARGPILQIEISNVHFGRAHVLQGVSLSLDRGVLAVVGRNGMGKSTLCMHHRLVPASGASVRGPGHSGLPPNRITNLGIGYVPQGRRAGPRSRSHEHLRLRSARWQRAWTVARIYQLFPRLRAQEEWRRASFRAGAADAAIAAPAVRAQAAVMTSDGGLAPVIVDQWSTC